MRESMEVPPSSFYDLEMRNPKRRTGFATVGRNMMHQTKRDFEGRLLAEDELKREEELKFYERLVGMLITVSLDERSQG